MVALVMAVFFVIAVLTNIIGPIIPDMIDSFHISLAGAALLPFAFFIAYGVASIPAGVLIEECGEKAVMGSAFAASFVAALAFALAPVYWMALPSFFLIGLAMAVLQVAINPLLRVAGGEENYAFNSAMAQLVFGSASFLTPLLYSYLVTNVGSAKGPVVSLLARVVPAQLRWVSVYWVFAAVSLAAVLATASSRFPRVERTEAERAGTWAVHRRLMRNPIVLLYFVSMFAYVGTEQGTADWISKFLATYHGYNPQTAGAAAVSWFWGLLTAGCLLSMLLLKLFDSRRVLVVSAVAAMAALAAALFGPAWIAVWAFPAVGFCISAMWPIIMSLGLNSVADHHGAVAGILCTAMCGGAVVPVVIGQVGDAVGLRAGMFALYGTLVWILSIGFWAKPMITNKTLTSSASP